MHLFTYRCAACSQGFSHATSFCLGSDPAWKLSRLLQLVKVRTSTYGIGFRPDYASSRPRYRGQSKLRQIHESPPECRGEQSLSKLPKLGSEERGCRIGDLRIVGWVVGAKHHYDRRANVIAPVLCCAGEWFDCPDHAVSHEPDQRLPFATIEQSVQCSNDMLIHHLNIIADRGGGAFEERERARTRD